MNLEFRTFKLTGLLLALWVVRSPALEDRLTVDDTPPVRADNSAAQMLSEVIPAIVSVFPARILEDESLDSEEARRRFFNRELEQKEGAQREAGVGSGVLVTSDGYVITNAHVVSLSNGALADAVNVELTDKRRFAARIVGSDSLSDIALLKIEGQDFPSLSIANSDHLLVGDSVWAVGNPFKIGLTATAGMVSALNRTGLGITGQGGYEAFIQTDAPINPGNSGGALVDHQGRLVGINTAIWGGLRANVGIGFAVPSNFARHIVLRLQEDGEVKRGFMGLLVDEVDGESAKEAGIVRIRGALVREVLKDGPADQAGLKAGDVVLKVDSKEVSDSGYFRLLASLPKPGVKIVLSGRSEQMDREWILTLGESDDFSQVANEEFELPALKGLRVKVVSEGLEIVSLAEDVPIAIRSRLKIGMILVEANGQVMKGFQDGKALKSGVNRLKVLQAGREVVLSLKLN